VKLIATLGALLFLILAPRALAIDEGVPDRDRHPFVGLLGFDVDGPGPTPPALLCSGSVLSDRHFLTAAHCIPAVPPDVEWVVTLEPGRPAAPVVLPGIFPDDFPHPLTVPAKRGGVAVVHPDFDPERLAHDIAVIRFPDDTFAGVTPVTMPPAGLLDRVRGLERRSFRLVGYGTDPEYGEGPPVFIVEGYRQTRTAAFAALTRRQLLLEGGGCLGDSGSPQLLGEPGIAVSLLSDPGSDCRGPVASQRLDTRSERRFLARFVELP
jgi:Trypsin